METWTKVRIEVVGRAAKLYPNGSSRPSVVVDGLKGEDLHGAVGLWGYANEESYFTSGKNHAGCAAELEERIRRGRFVGNAVCKRRRRAGRADGIAPRRKQSDRNMVRPTGRTPHDNRHLARRLRAAVVSRREPERNPARGSRHGPCH